MNGVLRGGYMDSEHEHELPVALPTGRFAGREAFAQRVRAAFDVAVQRGWREIIVCDATFEDWPLHERAVNEALGAWAKSGRRFVMIASGYDAVLRQHARFVSWRKTWDHIIECRTNRRTDPLDFPSAIVTPDWALQRLDLVRSTGVCSEAPAYRVRVREALDELISVSSPGFPASILGL